MADREKRRLCDQVSELNRQNSQLRNQLDKAHNNAQIQKDLIRQLTIDKRAARSKVLDTKCALREMEDD